MKNLIHPNNRLYFLYARFIFACFWFGCKCFVRTSEWIRLVCNQEEKQSQSQSGWNRTFITVIQSTEILFAFLRCIHELSVSFQTPIESCRNPRLWSEHQTRFHGSCVIKSPLCFGSKRKITELPSYLLLSSHIFFFSFSFSHSLDLWKYCQKQQVAQCVLCWWSVFRRAGVCVWERSVAPAGPG